MTELVTIRGERGDVFLRSTAPDVVIAAWSPSGRRNPVWRGSIVVASEDAAFPKAAWKTRDASVLRSWVEDKHPAWLALAHASDIDPPTHRQQTSDDLDRLLAVQELRALGVLDESEYAAEASVLADSVAESTERSALQR
jgi:hypothetical protein